MYKFEPQETSVPKATVVPSRSPGLLISPVTVTSASDQPYLKYKEDSSRMHMPMSAPLYSNKTNKTLEQKPWF